MLKLNHPSSSSSFSNIKSLILGQHSLKKCEISPQKCLEWLDLYPQGSILYVSFGSQNTISASQMMELAKVWKIAANLSFGL
ncbi:hypothetical protein CsSME_00042669 [Camellia sinensis var. sinensis]